MIILLIIKQFHELTINSIHEYSLFSLCFCFSFCFVFLALHNSNKKEKGIDRCDYDSLFVLIHFFFFGAGLGKN